jgi:hypothetical protein
MDQADDPMTWLRDEEAAQPKAWDIRGFYSGSARSTAHDDAGHIPCGRMSADRL